VARTTKEERFLLKLFEMANESNPIDRYTIGSAMGQKSRGVDTIVNQLAQANFVKKASGDHVFLTPNGLELIDRLKNT